MNLQRLMERLKIDEGYSNKVYKDSLGYPTVGIGHLIVKQDGLFLGDIISDQKVKELFEHDIGIAIKDCYKVFGVSFFNSLTDIRQEAIVNLMFNLGITNFVLFKRTIKAIMLENYDDAVIHLKDSQWFKKVQKSRSKFIINSLKGTIDVK